MIQTLGYIADVAPTVVMVLFALATVCCVFILFHTGWLDGSDR